MFRGVIEDFKHAFNRPNNSHVQLIIINVAFFVIIGILGVFLDHLLPTDKPLITYVSLPSNLTNLAQKPWTIITYMFSHAGFGHIFWNMLILYWFGRIVTEFLGSAKVINLYVLGGLAGAIFYIAMYNLLPLYQYEVDRSILLGASGGVIAVVVGAATFLPDYSIHLILIGPVRIKYIALVVVILSFIQSTGSNAGGELAHLGGAAAGFVYIRQLQKGTDWGSWVISTMNFIKSFFVRQPNIKVTYKKKSASHSSSRRTATTSGAKTQQGKGKTSQAEIDEILDKISERGYESLSKEEKQKLFNASKK